jgi:hypothetical protein
VSVAEGVSVAAEVAVAVGPAGAITWQAVLNKARADKQARILIQHLMDFI